MQLPFSHSVSTVSNSRICRDIILSRLIAIWFCWRNVKKDVHLEEIELGGQIILKRIFKFEWEEVKWIGLSQNGDSGFAFVNMEMNILFHKSGREVFDYMRK